MTKYEKFLKGNIMPFTNLIVKFYKISAFFSRTHGKTFEWQGRMVYKYRVSVYKNKFYILIMRHPIPNIFFPVMFPHKKLESEHKKYWYKKLNEYPLIPKMSDYFILVRSSLKTLNRFLLNPGFYLHKREKDHDKL